MYVKVWHLVDFQKVGSSVRVLRSLPRGPLCGLWIVRPEHRSGVQRTAESEAGILGFEFQLVLQPTTCSHPLPSLPLRFLVKHASHLCLPQCGHKYRLVKYGKESSGVHRALSRTILSPWIGGGCLHPEVGKYGES